jgi:hypothetical protein
MSLQLTYRADSVAKIQAAAVIVFLLLEIGTKKSGEEPGIARVSER